MSENQKTATEPKELNWKAVSKMSELIATLYASNKEQKKAQKQICTYVQNLEQPNQSNDLSNEYENTNK